MTGNRSETRPPSIRLEEILLATHADPSEPFSPDMTFRWIERDSRAIESGDLFIAVKGERFDGHDFVELALAQGATAALVSSEWASSHGRGPFIVVPDPVEALQQIARQRRNALGVSVVGVTGSLGKTSTKEAIAAGLGDTFNTYRSPGNMNSEIGLPVSILEIQSDQELAVLEMGGAYAPGEVDLLASIASPRVGVVTNIHPIHLERMGTIEAIADTKAELVRALPRDGFAILNADDARVMEMGTQTDATVITVGRQAVADVRATEVQTHGLDGTSFTVETGGDRIAVHLPMVGAHVPELALAALGVASAFDVSPEVALEGMTRNAPQVRLRPEHGINDSRIIDDTYNSSLPSTRSALILLDEIPADRRIAVLGDMRELGEETEYQHREAGILVEGVADVLFTFGELARSIAESARVQRAVDRRPMRIQSFGSDQAAELIEVLHAELRAGDVALIKGSRGLEMERIVDEIRREEQSGQSPTK